MLLLPWAWHEGRVAATLQPTTAPLRAASTSVVGSGPCDQPLPCAHTPGAGVMTIVWVLGYPGCFLQYSGPRPFTFRGELIRLGEVYLSTRWPGGFSASVWTEQ